MGKRPKATAGRRPGWAAPTWLAVIVAILAAALGLTVAAQKRFGKRPGRKRFGKRPGRGRFGKRPG